MLAVYLSVLADPRDQDDFTALYQRCKGRAMYLARRILRDEAAAQDAVHDGFLYLAEHYEIQKGARSEEMDAYLLDCVESRALDLLRKKRRETGDEQTLLQAENGEADIERRLVAAERLEQAMAVIERLEEIYRVTLMLHYQDGWSIQKIADYMGVPVKTAQKRRERARAKVWRAVEKYDAGIADPL